MVEVNVDPDTGQVRLLDSMTVYTMRERLPGSMTEVAARAMAGATLPRER